METYLSSKIPALASWNVNILGIDPSLNSTGLCVFEGEKLKMTYRVQTGLFGIERIIAIRTYVEMVMDKHSIGFIGMEGYVYGRSMLVNKSFELHELGGVLKAEFFNRSITPFIYSPMTIKKFTTGTGRKVKKEDMAAGIRKHWNLNFNKKQNDLGDAYAIGKFTYYLSAAVTMKLEPKHIYRGVLEEYQVEALQGAYSRLLERAKDE